MAVHIHQPQTLADIAIDLQAITERLEKLRKNMVDAKVKELGFDGEKGQVIGRTALWGFILSGEQRLRKLKDERYLKSIGEEK